MATNIATILDKPSNQIEPPKTAPAGTYLWVVKGMPRYDKSPEKKTDFAEFTLQALQAIDVDEDALAEWMQNPDGTTKTIQELVQKPKFYLTEGAAFMAVDFVNACGAGEEEMSLRARFEAAPGCQVLGTITHKPTSDGKRMFAELRSFAKVGGDEDND